MEAQKPADHQPPAFYLLLLLQAGERFAYYGARALLALFLHEHTGFTAASVASAFALFYGATSLAPLLGGLLADRVIGPRQVLLAGLALSAAGALVTGAGLDPFLGLGLLALGTGLTRPPLLVLLGQLYRQGDPRRDSGFTWLYVGVNAAALLGPTVFSVIASTSGIGVALQSSGALMLVALAAAAAGQRVLPADGYEPGEEAAPRAHLSRRDAVAAALCAVTMAILVAAALPIGRALAPMISPVPLMVGVMLALILTLFAVDRARAAARGDAARPLGVAAWQRLFVLALLALLTIPAWMAQDLQSRATSIALVGAREYAWLYGFQGICVLIAGPILALVWRRVDGAARPVSGLVKLAGGMLVTGAGVAALLATGGEAPAAIPVLALSSLMIAVGELCLIPIGQAMVTKLAPARSVTTAMGAWSTLAALGTSLLPMLARGPEAPGPLIVGGVAITAAAAGGLLLVLGPRLRGWMHGAEEPAPARAAGDPYRGAGFQALEAAAAAAEPGAAPARQMAVGALWALGGLVVTLGSLAAAEGGGKYVVAYGAILYGVITFLRGLAGWSGGRRS